MSQCSLFLGRAGIGAPSRPIGSFLFLGPTGVGKTELARQLANAMGVAFHRFDMSEYMEKHSVSRLIGAPPGYVGFDQGGLLTDAVYKTPHCVIVLDEIEKAHRDVFNILLQVMDHGTLTDTNGKVADFRQVTLLMTSNVGAREMSGRAVGFGTGGGARLDAEGQQAYERFFSPEFRNRLDARLQFNALTPEVMELIVDKFLDELRSQLRQKKVSIELADGGRKLLAQLGYDPAFGARPLSRVIEDKVKRPLTDEILFGALEGGGKVTVDAAGDEIDLRYNEDS